MPPLTLFLPRDFVEYYAAARVHLAGGNPYDGSTLLPVQLAIGHAHPTRPVMLWTPPWTLPLYWPFAMLPPYSGQLVWLAVQALTLAVACGMLWRTYRPGGSWLACGIAALFPILFAPTWWMLNFGQNTGFLTLGLAGYLYFRSRESPVRAGLFVALTAIKPHLLALFGLTLILDSLAPGRRRVLISGMAMIVGASALAMIPNPRVFKQFREAMAEPNSETHPHPSKWQVPTISYRIRDAVETSLAREHGSLFVVQFVPLAIGVVAVVPYWWTRRRTWDWREETPRLVLASVLLAPYGAWIFDLTVLLVPVMQMLAWLANTARPVNVFAGIVAVMCLSFSTMNRAWVTSLEHMIWFAPGVAVLYGVAMLRSRIRD